MGLYLDEMATGPGKIQLILMHKSFGLLALFLVIGCIIWRVITPRPDDLATHAKWETTLAHAAHMFLYVAMIGMPLSGWIMSSAGEYPVMFFGIDMPALVGKDQVLAKLGHAVHGYLAYGLIVALGLHIAGAFKHVIIDRDETLERMTFLKGAFGAVVIALMTMASFAFTGYVLIQPEGRSMNTIRKKRLRLLPPKLYLMR